MREYTTQMDAARKGIVTPEIKAVAEKEHMTSEALMKLVAEGKVAICANKNHTCLNPEGVGSMLRTKINVNLGVSRDCKDYDIEMQKVMSAVNMGAEAIMDLSSHGDTQPFRRKLTHECPAMIGTVPVYGLTCCAEAFGTGVLGGIAAYPVAKLLMGLNPTGLFVYIVPFLVSTVVGSILAYVLISALEKGGALNQIRTER